MATRRVVADQASLLLCTVGVRQTARQGAWAAVPFRRGPHVIPPARAV